MEEMVGESRADHGAAFSGNYGVGMQQKYGMRHTNVATHV